MSDCYEINTEEVTELVFALTLKANLILPPKLKELIAEGTPGNVLCEIFCDDA